MIAKSFFLQLLFVLAASTFAQEPTQIKKLPDLKEPRPRLVDIKHIKLELQFDWQKRRTSGTATISFSPLTPLNRFSLDAGFLTINSIKLDEKNLRFEYENSDKNDNLKITLDRVYESTETVAIRIDYHTNWINEIDPNAIPGGGSPGKGLRFSQPTGNDPLKPREIWSSGEPESNRYWFPSFDAPNDWRTTEFVATVDKNLTVISNGKLLKTLDNSDGTRTFHFKSDRPYANHLTSFVVGEFVNVKKNYQDIELNNFGYEREKDWVDASTERLPDMVSFFSEKTGLKFPFPSYSQVFVQDIGGWTSNMNLSTITENMVDDYATHADYLYLWDLTEAEALATQWFGNYLTAGDWSEAWLNKSLSRHLNGLYTDHKNGRAEWLLWVHAFDQGVYLNDWNTGVRRPLVTKHYADASTMTSDNYSSIRGGLVLNLLRKHLGDEKWWKAVRHFVANNHGKPVATADFQKSVEEISGEKFDWFFDQWVYKMGHPVFEVSKKYENGKLSVFVVQSQKTDPNDPYPQSEFFRGKIEIEIDGRIETVWLKPQTENNFTFNLPTAPKFVNFDYENSWIRELNYEQPFDELLAQFQTTKDALARQSAMFGLVRIAKDPKTSPDDKIKIRNALQTKLLGNEYWRVKLGILSQFVGLNPSDENTISTLLTIIKNEKAWLKSSAIAFLGNTKDPKYADVYLDALSDDSFRVIQTAAVALGKTKDPRAFDALVKLADKPSMKSQTMLSSLAGLRELGDPRGFDVAYKALENLNLPRWRLSSVPPSWDYRDSAAALIKSLGRSETAYPLIFERFKLSMSENDLNGIFTNILLIIALGDSRGQEAFDLLKTKYKDDASLMKTINQFEAQFKQ